MRNCRRVPIVIIENSCSVFLKNVNAALLRFILILCYRDIHWKVRYKHLLWLPTLNIIAFPLDITGVLSYPIVHQSWLGLKVNAFIHNIIHNIIMRSWARKTLICVVLLK